MSAVAIRISQESAIPAQLLLNENAGMPLAHTDKQVLTGHALNGL